jgi:hypothetical protein
MPERSNILTLRAGKLGDVAFLEEYHVPGIGKERGDVRGEQVLFLAEADYEGRVLARRDYALRVVGRNDAQGVRAADLGKRLLYGGKQVPFEVAFYQMGDYLGVGLGLEDMALAEKLFFKLEVVLDYAVMNYDDTSRAVGVRVGILLGGLAVRRPPGMADAYLPFKGVQRHYLRELVQFPHAPAQVYAVRRHHGYTGRIVAPVFEAAQPVQYYLACDLGADVPYNATHMFPLRQIYPGISKSAFFAC